MTGRQIGWVVFALSIYGVVFGRCVGAAALASLGAPRQHLPAVTRQLLEDMRTYCYACHHGEGGQVFDKFSRQPAFFAATSERELIQNIRQIASRAFRYLRLKRMPKATDPFLPMEKRRAMARAIKALAMAPLGDPPVAAPARLARVRAAYDRRIRPILEQKCDVCHGHGATRLQEILFGGSLRLAKREWDNSEGYPFGGDYAADPLLQLSMLEVVVVNRSMPPLAYTSTFPSERLSDPEAAHIVDWIEQARSVYGGEEG